MMRPLALSILLALGLGLALPALAPAPALAATSTEIAGLPSIPWQRVGQWVLKNALTLFMILEELCRDLEGPDTPHGDPPNGPPPVPLTVEAG